MGAGKPPQQRTWLVILLVALVPIASILFIIILLAVLAGIWYMIYGQPGPRPVPANPPSSPPQYPCAPGDALEPPVPIEGAC